MENRRNSHKYYIQPQLFSTYPNIIFEESACQKADRLLNRTFHNRLMKGSGKS